MRKKTKSSGESQFTSARLGAVIPDEAVPGAGAPCFVYMKPARAQREPKDRWTFFFLFCGLPCEVNSSKGVSSPLHGGFSRIGWLSFRARPHKV